MKFGKVLGLLASAAAVGGAVWYLTKKKEETTVLYSEEFDTDIQKDTTESANEETAE